MRLLLPLLLLGTLHANAQIDGTFDVIPAVCSLSNGAVQAVVTGGDARYT
jgi:hypothetical protein